MYTNKCRINRDGVIEYLSKRSVKTFTDSNKQLEYKIKCLKPTMIKQSENNVNIKPATVITITGTSENKILLKKAEQFLNNFHFCVI